MNLINRDNYHDVMTYLRFQEEVKQSDQQTITNYWYRLRHLLEWAQDRRFTEADKIKPTYPAYVDTLRTYAGRPIAASGFQDICKLARAFFSWAREEYQRPYRNIQKNWILSIRPPRSRGMQSELKEREVYQLGEVIQLVNFQTNDLTMQREKAAAAFLFLSGMRIGAFTSLPASCVDLDKLKVYQLPERGVLTKNKKAAVTTLLNIPELLGEIRAWDNLIRSNLGDDTYWYANFNSFGCLTSEKPDQKALMIRRHTFRVYLKRLCTEAGVVYKSPHKFRHGHAVYALKHAKNMAQLKAISQNLMHATIGITDGIYGRLVGDDVHDTILSLSEGPSLPVTIPAGPPSADTLAADFLEFLKAREKGGQV